MTSKSARKPSGGVFDVSKLAARQKELLEQSAKPDFWDRPDAAQAVLKELDRIKEQLVGYEGLRSCLEEARLFLTMAEEEGAEQTFYRQRSCEANRQSHEGHQRSSPQDHALY